MQSALLAVHKAVCGGFQPELTILLLPPLEASLMRARRRNERHARERGTDENRFEREGDEFYARVHEQYLVIARRDAQRVFVVATEDSIEAIAGRILEEVHARLQGAGRNFGFGMRDFERGLRLRGGANRRRVSPAPRVEARAAFLLSA